jgi:tetratricopeptide (TPR) repeat protein
MRLLIGALFAWMSFAWAVAPVHGVDGHPMLLPSRAMVEELVDVRELIFDLRLEEAEGRLSQMERRGGSAAALHHMSLISLLRGMLTDSDEHLDEFFERSDALKRALRSEPDGPWKLYLGAENELNRALAHTRANRQMRAALAGRAARDAYRTLHRRYPDFEEAYKGSGVIDLAIGTLPRAYQSVLRLIGIDGGVESGLSKLHRAAYRSEFSREEAGIFLALLMAQVERSSDEPVQVLAALRKKHPESPLLAYLHGYMLLHHRKSQQAIAVLETVARVSDRSITIPYAHFYLGQAYLARDDYDRAIRAFEAYLSAYDGPSLRAQTLVGLGLAHELSGRRDRAMTFYRRVDASRGYDGDLAARREADARTVAPLDQMTRTLILARNAFDSGRCERAVSLLSPIVSDADLSAAHRAEAAYRLGRAYECLDRLDEALAWYAQGALNARFVEGRWAPWGHFYRAEILSRQGDHERARAEYEAAAAFSHAFDYRDALHQSIRAALDRLRRSS